VTLPAIQSASIEPAPPRALMVGLGSAMGHDQLGWWAAAAVKDKAPCGVEVRRAAAAADVLDWMGDCKRLHVCDACVGTGVPGRVVRWRWPSPELLAVHWSGTHDWSLPAALKLAEQLGRLPAEVVVWGIEIGTPGGSELRAATLDRAVVTAAERICAELAADITTHA